MASIRSMAALRQVAGPMRTQVRRAAAVAYAERFDATAPGLGHFKKDLLRYGGWSGECNSTTLAKLWPEPALKGVSAARELAAFDGAVAKAPSNDTALLGRARARCATGNISGALDDIATVRGRAKNDDVKAFAVALEARISVIEVLKAEFASVACVATDPADKSGWVLKSTAAFEELLRLRPGDYQPLLAYGDFLARQGDSYPAVQRLSAALELLNKEVVGRQGATERFVQQGTSGAVSDYLDFKHEVPYTSALEGIIGTSRGDADMEKLISTKYGASQFNDQELRAVADLDAAIESGNLGFKQPLGAVGLGATRFRAFDSPLAVTVSALMHEYAGGSAAAAMAAGGSLDDRIAAASAVPDISPLPHLTLGTQKQLSVALATQERDRCRTQLGKALLHQGDAAAAHEHLSATVKGNSYLGMASTLKAYGDALTELGRVDEADKAYKRAQSLAVPPVGIDLPTFDEKSFRDHF